MIIYDAETTGLLNPSPTPLGQQPYLIEVGAMKVDDETLKPKKIGSELSFLIKPPMALPDIIIKITGLSDAKLASAKPFPAHYPALVDFFLGERIICCHNAPFDVGCLAVELARMGKRTNFPWPVEHWCTAERTAHLNVEKGGKYFKLEALYQFLFKKDPEQKHRALDDVKLLHKVMVELRKRKVL